MLVVVAALIGVPWVLVVLMFIGMAPSLRSATTSTASAAITTGGKLTDTLTLGNTGSWGQLSYSPIAIELPRELVYIPPASSPRTRWTFQGYTEEKALEFLHASGVSAAQFELLARDGHWTGDAARVLLEPGDSFILSLSPDVRGKIYNTLVEFPQNEHQIDPIWFRPDKVDWRLGDSGLAPESVSLVKRLLYPQGSTLSLFADFEPALRQMSSDGERFRLMNAISRKNTLLARLVIDVDADMEKVAQYWGAGGRRKDVLPLLRAMQREKRSSKINIVCILPDFARDHLYRHPELEVETKGVTHDCFWSAMNFFNDPPVDQFNDMKYLRGVLDRDYIKIMQPGQLGDLMFVTTPNESVIHAASYIADDIVFTKNGAAATQPWILMHTQDMLDTYAVRHPHSGPLQLRYFRLKTL